MFIFFFIVTVFIIYINSFKGDFTKEKVDKLAFVLWIIVIIVLLYGILANLTGH